MARFSRLHDKRNKPAMHSEGIVWCNTMPRFSGCNAPGFQVNFSGEQDNFTYRIHMDHNEAIAVAKSIMDYISNVTGQTLKDVE